MNVFNELTTAELEQHVSAMEWKIARLETQEDNVRVYGSLEDLARLNGEINWAMDELEQTRKQLALRSKRMASAVL